MIRQNGNQNTGRSVGRSNSGRQADTTQRNYNRSASFLGLGNLFGGGGQSTQTTTQQNLPDWAIPDAMSTLGMGNYYTQTPDYRASTLDRDYSGIRGYNAQGQPNSQVGGFGLSPMPALRMPALPGANLDGTMPYRPNDINNQISVPDNANLQSPLNLGRGSGASLTRPDGTLGQYGRGLKMDDPFFGTGREPGSNVLQPMPAQRPLQSPLNRNQPTSRGMGRSAAYYDSWDPRSQESNDETGNGSDSFEYQGPGSDLYNNYHSGGSGSDSGNDDSNNQTNDSNNQTNDSNNQTNDNTNTTNTTTTEPTIDPRNIFNPDDLTPFQAYDRQRFAAPGTNTLRGEGILAGRYDQRFGLGGTDPFADAKTAVDEAANYDSTFAGTTGIDPITGEKRIGSKAGNYQTGLKSAEDPGVFSGKTYTSNLDTKFSNPNAGMQNVNAGLQNVNAGVRNVNAGMRSQQFGNANEGLLGAQDYTTGRSFQDRVQDFMNPYTDQVVNRSLQDINRARLMADMSTMGGAAKSGAFGGSREALMRAENTRNALDQAGRTSGQLRSAGFNTAANLAQQEELQRLGLTASDRQNLRGYQSAGNLQGQTLTAADLQNVRGLQSQGALTAQGLRSQGALAAQALQSQGALAAQGLRSQGALAALNANANLYGQGLSLGAGLDQAALQANAGLLSDAMRLDAADLQQRRNIASNESQFAENANRGAGALNLQGGTALGNLAQAGIADERQRIADMLAAGQAGDTRNQQDLDFIYNEFQRELAYPGQQIDLRNAAISPATGSIVTTTQPRYEQNPILGGAGAALAAYGMTKNPYIAGGAALLSLLS